MQFNYFRGGLGSCAVEMHCERLPGPAASLPTVWQYHTAMANQPSFPPLRPSVSHNASRQAEIDRVRRMTVEERVKAALGFTQRFAAVQLAPARRDQ